MARRKWNLEIIEQVLDGEQPFIQVGYDPKPKKRKDGEIWTDVHGVTWKQLDGSHRIQVNEKADLIRDSLKRICSKCGQNIDFSCDKLDEKVWPKTGKCYNCLELEEFELRVLGKYEDYEKMKVLKNKRGLLQDFKCKVIEAIDFLKNDSGKMSQVMEDGEVLTWTGNSNPQWILDAERDLVKVNEELEKMEKEITELESKIKICQDTQPQKV